MVVQYCSSKIPLDGVMTMETRMNVWEDGDVVMMAVDDEEGEEEEDDDMGGMPGGEGQELHRMINAELRRKRTR